MNRRAGLGGAVALVSIIAALHLMAATPEPAAAAPGKAVPATAAPATAAPTTTGPPARAITWLAIGDSYSSGEGLPDSAGACGQLPSGSASSAYAQVGAERVSRTLALAQPLNLQACSGTTLRRALTPAGSAQWNLSNAKYDLVTLTLGSDDLDFLAITHQCLGLGGSQQLANSIEGNGSTSALATDANQLCPKDALLRDATAKVVDTNYGTFLNILALQTVTPGGNIVVVGYPEIVEDPAKWQGLSKALGVCQGIGSKDANELRGLVRNLNAGIGTAVAAANQARTNGVHFTFVDVNSGGGSSIVDSDPRLFEPTKGNRHNLCTAESWINGPSPLNDGAGSYHPNQSAHQAEGSLLAQVILQYLDWTRLDLLPSALDAGTSTGRPIPSPGSATPTRATPTGATPTGSTPSPSPVKPGNATAASTSVPGDGPGVGPGPTSQRGPAPGPAPDPATTPTTPAAPVATTVPQPPDPTAAPTDLPTTEPVVETPTPLQP